MPNNEENTTDSSEQGNDYLDMKNKNYSNIFFNTFSSISELIELRNKCPKSPIIVYLNINSLRNKIIDLREKMSKASLVIVCIDKTKLDESFPASQFLMENYHQFPPFRRDRNSKGAGKLGFVKMASLLKESKKRIYLEQYVLNSISKKKWCILFAYKPPKQSNVLFFQEISNSLNQVVNKYENIFLAVDLNIGLLDSKSNTSNHFSVLRDMYDLTNLVNVPTCYKNLFDCIPHNLLIAKLHAYGLTTEALTFLYSYLKRRQQGVKINDAESIFKILLSGVP